MNRRSGCIVIVAVALSTLGACSLALDTFGLAGNVTPNDGQNSDPDARTESGVPSAAGDSASEAGESVRRGPAPGCGAGGPGLTDCGPDGGLSCCERPLVTAEQTFRRSADNSEGNKYAGRGRDQCCAVATLSSFGLDRFEVTVGRFRRFQAAVTAGWLPGAGTGKHTHLNEGKGLTLRILGTFELGWNSEWDSTLTRGQTARNIDHSCKNSNWTDVAGSQQTETQPINCASWYEAYAFCNWDGGFLPSFAEWNYAAAGGRGERVWPWSNPGDDRTPPICSQANFGGANFPDTACVDAGTSNEGRTVAVGTFSPKGDGVFGQSDLAGNVAEWLFDRDGTMFTPCFDCAVLSDEEPPRMALGGSFSSTADQIRTTYVKSVLPSEGHIPETQSDKIGFRCARAP